MPSGTSPGLEAVLCLFSLYVGLEKLQETPSDTQGHQVQVARGRLSASNAPSFRKRHT